MNEQSNTVHHETRGRPWRSPDIIVGRHNSVRYAAAFEFVCSCQEHVGVYGGQVYLFSLETVRWKGVEALQWQRLRHERNETITTR